MLPTSWERMNRCWYLQIRELSYISAVESLQFLVNNVEILPYNIPCSFTLTSLSSIQRWQYEGADFNAVYCHWLYFFRLSSPKNHQTDYWVDRLTHEFQWLMSPRNMLHQRKIMSHFRGVEFMEWPLLCEADWADHRIYKRRAEKPGRIIN